MLRSAGGNPVTALPLKRISPDVLFCSPAMHRSVVVLPQPDGPSRTMNSPSCRVSERPSTAVTPPKRTVRSSMSTWAIARALQTRFERLVRLRTKTMESPRMMTRRMMANADALPVWKYPNAILLRLYAAVSVSDPGPPPVIATNRSNCLKASMRRNRNAIMMIGKDMGSVTRKKV